MAQLVNEDRAENIPVLSGRLVVFMMFPMHSCFEAIRPSTSISQWTSDTLLIRLKCFVSKLGYISTNKLPLQSPTIVLLYPTPFLPFRLFSIIISVVLQTSTNNRSFVFILEFLLSCSATSISSPSMLQKILHQKLQCCCIIAFRLYFSYISRI